MKEGDSINLLEMIDKEGFIPYRQILKGKELIDVEESRDRLNFFSSMTPGALTIKMMHPDGRILIYGLCVVYRPPGFIWKNF